MVIQFGAEDILLSLKLNLEELTGSCTDVSEITLRTT